MLSSLLILPILPSSIPARFMFRCIFISPCFVCFHDAYLVLYAYSIGFYTSLYAFHAALHRGCLLSLRLPPSRANNRIIRYSIPIDKDQAAHPKADARRLPNRVIVSFLSLTHGYKVVFSTSPNASLSNLSHIDFSDFTMLGLSSSSSDYHFHPLRPHTQKAEL